MRSEPTSPATVPVHRGIYNQIRATMDAGELRPGHLLSVMQIAKAFDVSRSSVGQALDLLVAGKLLTRLERKGYLVTRPRQGRIDPADVAPYSFGPTPIAMAPSWKRVYKELEREVATQMLFRSVRVTEDRLSSHFGVSRTVVREALAQLAANGLVAKDRQGHWYANRVTPATLHSMYELRWLLEPAALLDSAPKLPKSSVEMAWRRLNTTIRRFPRVGSSDLDQLEHDLHDTLLGHCANKPLLRVLAQTRLLIIATRYIFDDYLSISTTISHQSALEHLRVIECVRAGDFAGAGAALREHLHNSLGHWIRRLENVAQIAQPPMPAFLVSVDEGKR
jgi:DNA-binding GntR family transcriptional regulator